MRDAFYGRVCDLWAGNGLPSPRIGSQGVRARRSTVLLPAASSGRTVLWRDCMTEKAHQELLCSQVGGRLDVIVRLVDTQRAGQEKAGGGVLPLPHQPPAE